MNYRKVIFEAKYSNGTPIPSDESMVVELFANKRREIDGAIFTERPIIKNFVGKATLDLEVTQPGWV